MKKITATLFAIGLIQGCSHPLEIVGEGDITELNGTGRGCTLEQYQAQDDACVKNVVLGDYDVEYSPAPRTGWEFIRWDGPPCNVNDPMPSCSFIIPAAFVQELWFQTVPATRAVFCDSSEITYRQDFEGMSTGQGFPPNDLAADGWKIFGAEYAVNPYTNPGAIPTASYGPFDAANGAPGSIQAVGADEGGHGQGVRHLNKFSDYENVSQPTKFVEGITLQQPFTVSAGDVGVWTLSFDAKRKDPADFGIGGQSSAYAFIKTLDPVGFFETGLVTRDMTSAGKVEQWRRYSISLDITPDMIGDILQFGFSATAINYEPSGIYYDNVIFGTCSAL